MGEKAPQNPMTPGEIAILSQMLEYRDECLDAITQCCAEVLMVVRQMMGLNKAVSKLMQEVQELKQQLTKDRLFDS
jgi:hypothetical protein